MIDTHCHLTFDQFDGRVGQIMQRAAAVGVRGAITVATTSAEAEKALALTRAHENLWCTAGVHPLYSDEPVDWERIGSVARETRCVAWGELGLDNHYRRPPRDVQHRVLEEQLRFIEASTGEGLALPVVVHCREAFDELLAVFAASSLDPGRYVFHCFTGTPDDARRVLDFGAWISFTGVVTFKNAPEVADAARLVPLDRMMVETDAPFLSPEPVRTVRPNEPAHVVHIARFIAALRGIDPTELEHTLDANAERFFGIELT